MAKNYEITEENLLDRAWACLNRDDHEQAKSLCNEVLSENPSDARAYTILGSIFAKTIEYGEAHRNFKRATELEPTNPTLWINLGESLALNQQYDEALCSYQEALNLAPDSAYAHFAIANLRSQLGDLQKAISSYYRANRFKPKDPSILFNYAVAQMSTGEFSDAIETFQQVLSVSPKHMQSIFRLGKSYIAIHQYKDASDHYDKYLLQFPDNVNLHHAQGQCSILNKAPTKALEHFERAFALDPKTGGLKNNLAIALHDVGRTEEALDILETLVRSFPASHRIHSNRLLTAHYSARFSPTQLATLHREAGRALVNSSPKSFTHYPQSSSPSRRIKVGFLSPDFRAHPVGYFLLPLFRNLTKDHFEIYSYSDAPRTDSLTQELEGLSDHFLNSKRLTVSQLVDQIRSDEIDVLLDLAGHTARNRLSLFALKPAPVQISGFGYVNTTGLPTMDYLITDSIQCPKGSDDLYSERLLRLPNDYICYTPPDEIPDVNDLPALTTSHLTLGCLNRLAKLTPPTIKLWCELLAEIPSAQLLIRTNGLEDDNLAQHYRRQFEKEGLEAGRLTLMGGTSHREFLQTYNSIDISLDPFPYSGGLVTCEALWMGVPVVTLRGERFASLHSSSHLINSGLEKWVADSKNAYINIVKEASTNLDALAQLRRTLRAQVSTSPLSDGPRYARDFEDAIRGCWHRWCEQVNNDSQS